MALEHVTRIANLLESYFSDPTAVGDTTDLVSLPLNLGLAHGTGANQADLRWSSAGRSLGASAGENIDLNGSLTYKGANINFARVKILGIRTPAANPNNLIIGNASSAGWQGPFGALTHTYAIPPGMVQGFAKVDATGWPVTATTADILRILNGGAGTVTYDICIIGCSA